MRDILGEIMARKRSEVEAALARVPRAEMADRAQNAAEKPRGFRAALAAAPAPVVIAEIKRRSPSRGEIRPGLDPAACARAYAEAGAAAISVLTDPHYFGGSLEDLQRVRSAVTLPILRKDFVLDPYQIDEARAWGADAVLLIAAALEGEELVRLRDYAGRLEMDSLVEVHDEEELELALKAGATLIGINNRNLRSFEVDLGVTERLAQRLRAGFQVPNPPLAEREPLLVAESGIASHEDVCRLQQAGAGAFLVGESLMRQDDVGLALRQLRRSS